MSHQSDDQSDISFRAVARLFWEGKWIVAATVSLGTALAVAYAMWATPIFRAEALVQARDDTKAGLGLGVLAAPLGGLSELAGLSGASGTRAVAMATLKSRSVIEPFIAEEGLLPLLYADLWDAAAGSWKDSSPVPSVWQAYNDFTRGILKVTEDRKTGLATVAVEWKDPELARRWVTALVARTNQHLKSVAIREGESNLGYLEGQSRRVGQIEVQRAVYGLIESELKKLMLAKGSEEFAIRTVDPAVTPQRKIRPRRAQMVAVGFLLGGLLGVAVVLIRGAVVIPRA